MEISTNKNTIKELQIALSYYIRGLIVSSNNNDWTSPIQRIVEHSLMTYSVIDIRKNNYLELIDIKINNNKFILDFSNKNCKYAEFIKSIKVNIPFIQPNENVFELKGNVVVNI